MKTITREELKKKMDNGDTFRLVNVLGKHEFEHVRIPGSINISVDEVDEKAPKILNKDNEIIVYCASFTCQASPTAARKLTRMGFKNVIDYGGGIQDWVDAGYPIVSGKTNIM